RVVSQFPVSPSLGHNPAKGSSSWRVCRDGKQKINFARIARLIEFSAATVSLDGRTHDFEEKQMGQGASLCLRCTNSRRSGDGCTVAGTGETSQGDASYGCKKAQHRPNAHGQSRLW